MARKARVAEEAEPKIEKRNPEWSALGKVAADLKMWRPAQSVLRPVRAVPTIFPAFDRATRVGGFPLDRFSVIHGPSSHGKTSFAHGLGLSFLRAGHFYAFIDAEMTSPIEWLNGLLGEQVDNPGFLALRPKSYEETVDAVRAFVNRIAKARDKREIPEETSALIVVDSIRKLIPEDFLAKIEKQGAQGAKGSVDGMSGRGAMIKAAMHAAWLDEVIPLLYHTRTAMLALAREREDSNMYGPGYKMGGGVAIEYEASLVARITRSWVKEGTGEDAQVVGERHEVAIRKSKVAGKDDKISYGSFHTSNGALIPEGFDLARDLIELGLEFGIVKQSGSWLTWRGKRWQGKGVAIQKLTSDLQGMKELESQIREGFADGSAAET